MRRSGGVFVGGFLALTVLQAVAGVIPSAPSLAAPAGKQSPARKPPQEHCKNRNDAGPVKPGSLPVGEWEALFNTWGNCCPELTPARLAAQLHQESIGFREDVVSGRTQSPAGAKGIAQFIDGTWKTHGIDANGDGRRNKFDPRDAIPSAAVYNCKVAKWVGGGSSDNMLAAYNAGPNAVRRYGGIPPYRETRTYVKLINKRTKRFQS